MKRDKWLLARLARYATFATIAAVVLLIGETKAALVYWQNFDGGNGVADVGVGNLGIINKTAPDPGTTFFNPTGGIFGGSYDHSSNVAGAATANFNGVASTTGAGGSSLSALPNSGTLNQFTVSFWFNTDTISPTAGRAGRLLTVGDSGTTDLLGVNAIGFAQISTVDPGATTIVPFFKGSDLTMAGGIGAANSADSWVFVAVTYDGTSTFGNNSSIQNAATGGSTINGQFYRGTDVDSVVRTDLPMVSVFGDPGSSSLGALNLGTNAILFLGNRPTLVRPGDGWIDDVRIYDGVLSAAEVEGVRLEGIQGVPEPSSWIIIGIGLATTFSGCYIRGRKGLRGN